MMLLNLTAIHTLIVKLKCYIKQKQFNAIIYMCPENLCMRCEKFFINMTGASQICYC